MSSDDDDAFSPTEWDIVEKVRSDGTTTKVRTRSSVTVITPKNTMKLEDKTVEETPVVAEEIELDESSPHEHLDPEEWDIIEKKMPGEGQNLITPEVAPQGIFGLVNVRYNKDMFHTFR